MNTAPRISIVIRCFNEEQHIGRLLTGILEQTEQGVEIIVVDSGSTDATVSIASRFPVTLCTIRPEDFSFGYALNKGIAVARGEFVVAASAHVYPVYQDWLEKLLAPFADPAVALVYGKQRGNEQTKYAEHQVLTRWFPEASNFNQTHAFCNNANAAIRRALWQEMPYDEDLTGLEDIDWARRALERGYELAYAADAVIIHVHDETARVIFNRYQREAIALKRIYPEENFSFWDFTRLCISSIASDSYHAWHDRRFPREVPEIIQFRLMQFLGTYEGFAQHGSVTSTLKHRFYYPKGLRRAATEKPPEGQRRLIAYTEVSHASASHETTSEA
jgi:glycosyltransferase involved in cell wall biosynthesis